MTCTPSPEDPKSAPPRSAAEATSQPESAQPEPQRLFRVDPNLAPGLYVVSTPIGNLRDITLRALDILASADFVCAEDTRVSGKLLASFGVSARLRPYHDHNAAEARPALIRELKGGARVALVSDAGTPLVSDPGYKLVREAAAEGVPVFTVPGASAVLAGLSISGLPTDRFMFAGFPPPKSGARKHFLADLKDVLGTLIFFEGPSRLAASLADMTEVFGQRDAAIARELTKKFEEVRRGRLDQLAAAYAAEDPPRGELVVLVGPPGAEPRDEGALDRMIAEADLSRPAKEIAAEIAEKLGVKRRDVYERLLELKDQDEASEA
jgi:16S rRNA (cytidine1402-2'-O)-methyltransferase